MSVNHRLFGLSTKGRPEMMYAYPNQFNQPTLTTY